MPLQSAKKHWRTTLTSFVLSLRCTLSPQEYWGILFFSCFCLFLPKLWFVVAGFLIYKIERVEMKLRPIPLELPNIVLHIQMNHIQSLTDAIESNPEILYAQYKKQSLLAWCQYYKNPNAQILITQLMEKHPHIEQTSIAA